jgi:hypothetical protein
MTEAVQDLANVLTPEERALLKTLEKRISHGWQSFTDVGDALLTVRDRKLYREKYRTFGDYSEKEWGFSRQRAHQLMDAATTTHALSTTVDIQSEREARELKGTVKIVEALSPESQQALSTFLKTSTGSDRPTTSQVKAVAEVVQKIDAHGTVQHPDNGEEVPFASLTGEQRVAVVRENVTNSTYERVKRQEGHIEESKLTAKSNGRGGWADWCLDYAQQNLTDTQELRIVVKRDASGNAQVTALIVDTETHATVAFGDSAGWLKKAVMNLVEEIKGV